MDPNILKFRLRRLPLLARENVLRTMEWFDIITISHCSKRFKLFVKSLKIKSNLLHLTISNEIVVDIGVKGWPRLVFKLEETGNRLEEPCKLGVYNGKNRTFEITTLTIGNWLHHFAELFHCAKLNLGFWKGSEVFDARSLQNTLRGLTINSLTLVDARLPDQTSIKAMETFLPVENFNLYKNPFPSHLTLRKAIRDIEFNQLTLHNEIPITLSDILVLNAVDINIWKCEMSENDINVLFRVWKNGWNPKLNYLFMKFLRDDFPDDYEATILDGLGAVKNEEETFFNGKYGRYKIPVKGGYDIKKCDGTNATILFETHRRAVDVRLMIWN